MFDNKFLTDESGAVTVDWVVLTAALVGLGLAVMAVVSTGLEDLTGDINTQMSDGSIIRTAFTGSVAGARDAACGATSYCDDSLSASALQGLGSSAMAGINDVDYGTDYVTDLNAGLAPGDDPFVVNGGEIGTNTGAGGAFVATSDTTVSDGYNAASAASTAQNALIQAERDARAN